MWLKAFSISNSPKKPKTPPLIIFSNYSLAMRMKSSICLSLTKAFWDFVIFFPNYAQTIGKHHWDDLVYIINKTDGKKILHFYGSKFFRYKCNERSIKAFLEFHKWSKFKKNLTILQHTPKNAREKPYGLDSSYHTKHLLLIGHSIQLIHL